MCWKRGNARYLMENVKKGDVIRYQSLESDIIIEIDSPERAEELMRTGLADLEELQHYAFSAPPTR